MSLALALKGSRCCRAGMMGAHVRDQSVTLLGTWPRSLRRVLRGAKTVPPSFGRDPEMAVDESPSIQTHTAQLLSGPSRGWEESERELVETGLSLPLHHRTVWAGAHSSAQSWVLAVRDAAGRCTCGFAIDVTRSRVLPGHLLLRVERFGPALNDEARVAAVTELARLARRAPVLRVYL